VNFADPLKEALETIGVPHGSLWGSQEQKDTPLKRFNGLSGRQIAQMFGTEFGRKMLCDDVWLNAWADRVALIRGPVVVADVRFENEAAKVRSLGGVVIKVVRPGVVGTKHGAHDSERHVDFIKEDVLLINSGSVDVLAQKIVGIVDQYNANREFAKKNRQWC
jgi:hypothetical protein